MTGITNFREMIDALAEEQSKAIHEISAWKESDRADRNEKLEFWRARKSLLDSLLSRVVEMPELIDEQNDPAFVPVEARQNAAPNVAKHM